MVAFEFDPRAGHTEEDVVTLDADDQQLPVAIQRWIAERLVTERKAEEGLAPALRTHPHAERARQDAWIVRGRWLPTQEVNGTQGAF